ncbi:hypothetical protein GCM10023191_066280 [Actinoallomurus oryzae]|uniref:Pyridoxamine 5'-phosphate oxidase putative domain-containing protein n=1 Tax=Actinoallomurus oryzae TaxID=502180 RepID=A0ABP8QPK7_9ACTN
MADTLGDRLPDELVHALDDEALTDEDQTGFLLVTTDENGAPRICIVSAGELLLCDERTLRVALWHGTRTAHNLGRSGTALLAAISPRARNLRPGRTRAAGGPGDGEPGVLRTDREERRGGRPRRNARYHRHHVPRRSARPRHRGRGLAPATCVARERRGISDLISDVRRGTRDHALPLADVLSTHQHEVHTGLRACRAPGDSLGSGSLISLAWVNAGPENHPGPAK